MSRGTVKPSSARTASAAAAAASGVVPLLPAVWGPGVCGVSVEDEGDEPAEEAVRVPVAKELCDAFKGDDPADCLDNEPEIRQRLRAFHIV